MRTEQEWFAAACTDAQVLSGGYPGMPSERKLRLFGCACLRSLDVLFRYPDGPKCIAACERYADGEIKGKTLLRWRRVAAALRYKGTVPGQTDMNQWYAATYLLEACDSTHNGWVFTAESILREEAGKPFGAEFLAGAKERFTGFLRDVFGNPFRPVAFDPDWRTGHTAGIASTMYKGRDFAAMPILGDALEDAGCEDTDILTHCREPGDHVRGCWVIDWLLGRE